MIYSHTVYTAKDASLIPLFKSGKPMHSRYRPTAEVLPCQDISGCLIVAGIGAGFHIKNTLLQNEHISLLVAVEADKESLEFCQHFEAVREASSMPAVVLCDAASIEETLKAHYIPAIHKNIALLFQRAWESENPDTAQAVSNAVKRAIDQIAADFSVQSHFGKLWHKNILLNLSYICKLCSTQEDAALAHCPTRFPVEKTAAIIAAGPSLDGCIEQIRAGSEKGELFVVAADTAFGTLQKSGITPDAVVSIDAQHVSSRHFLCTPSSSKTMFVFDLCTPPALAPYVASKGNAVLFVRTGHPLSALAAKALTIPLLDSGSGTVTIAAADWAKSVGFRSLKFFGADFAYLNGKPYAKGTYLDAEFYTKTNRTRTAETSFCALMFRCELKEALGKSNAVTTEILEGYGTSLLEWVRRNGFCKQDGLFVKGDDAPLTTTLAQSASGSSLSFQQFTQNVLHEIEALLQGDEHTLIERVLKSEVGVALLPYFAFLKDSPLSESLKLAYRQTVRYNAPL